MCIDEANLYFCISFSFVVAWFVPTSYYIHHSITIVTYCGLSTLSTTSWFHFC
eukprot:m.37492 g.37492  ORF g.37492 m.37492 type:complete len:53 (+) comp10103_c0_seq1:225-383(+)